MVSRPGRIRTRRPLDSQLAVGCTTPLSWFSLQRVPAGHCGLSQCSQGSGGGRAPRRPRREGVGCCLPRWTPGEAAVMRSPGIREDTEWTYSGPSCQ